MCRLERKTARRGRSGVPDTRLRTRACRLRRPARLALAASISGAVLSVPAARIADPGGAGGLVLLGGLAGLAAHGLARVAHALALVRVGLAQRADLGRDLADLLLVDALDGQPGRRADLERDPVGGLDAH